MIIAGKKLIFFSKMAFFSKNHLKNIKWRRKEMPFSHEYEPINPPKSYFAAKCSSHLLTEISKNKRQRRYKKEKSSRPRDDFRNDKIPRI